MFRIQALAVALSFAVGGSAWAQAVAPAPSTPVAATGGVASDAVVLNSGNFKLSRAEYEKLILGFDRITGAVTSGATPQSVQSGQEVARLLAMVTEAQRRKIDQTPRMQALLQVRSYVLLSNALMLELQDEAKKDEAGTHALWESDKSRYFDVVARQILIRHQGAAVEGSNTAGNTRTPAQAKALAEQVVQKLKGGADFAKLALTSSDDASTRSAGGLLPAFTRGAMQSEFELAAFDTPVGGVSQAFKTKYGYHVIKVEERRPFAFERVRSTLEYARAKEKLEAISSAGIQLDKGYFKP
jgi:parvulin-like peptidyl-prolyl isomerase